MGNYSRIRLLRDWKLKQLFMKYNLLGQTGLKVSELCLGAMTFGGKGFWTVIGTLDLDVVIPAIRELLDDETRETRGKAEDALDDIEIFMLRKA